MEKVQTFYRVSDKEEDIFRVTSFLYPSNKAVRDLPAAHASLMSEAIKGIKSMIGDAITQDNAELRNGHEMHGVYAKGACCFETLDDTRTFAIRQSKNPLGLFGNVTVNIKTQCIFEFEGERISRTWTERAGEKALIAIPKTLLHVIPIFSGHRHNARCAVD